MRTDDGQGPVGLALGRGDTRGIALVFFVAGFIMLIAVLLAFVSRPYRQLTAAYESDLRCVRVPAPMTTLDADATA